MIGLGLDGNHTAQLALKGLAEALEGTYSDSANGMELVTQFETITETIAEQASSGSCRETKDRCAVVVRYESEGRRLVVDGASHTRLLQNHKNLQDWERADGGNRRLVVNIAGYLTKWDEFLDCYQVD